MILPRNFICFLTPAGHDEGGPGRGGCVQVSSLVSHAAPERKLWSSENWLPPLLLPPPSSQDVSSDGGGWGKCLWEFKWTTNGGEPFPLGSMRADSTLQVPAFHSIQTLADSPAQSYKQAKCKLQTNTVTSATTCDFLKMHRLSDKTPTPLRSHSQVKTTMENQNPWAKGAEICRKSPRFLKPQPPTSPALALPGSLLQDYACSARSEIPVPWMPLMPHNQITMLGDN